jgi:tetratricopeptide (TPR) repeat protein
MFKGEYEDWASKYGPYMYKADNYFEHKQYQKTIECLDKCLEIDPSDAELWFYKGRALRFLGQLSDAFIYFNKAAELDPYDTEYLGMQAYVSNELKQSGTHYKKSEVIKQNNDRIEFITDSEVMGYEETEETYVYLKKVLLGYVDDEGNCDKSFDDFEKKQFLSKVDTIYLTSGNDAYFEKPATFMVGIYTKKLRILNMIQAVIHTPQGYPVRSITDTIASNPIIAKIKGDIEHGLFPKG